MLNKEPPRLREVVVKAEFVELCDLLKLENLTQSGGEAKFVISEGRVRVNGEVETRKRKKVRPGDVVDYAGTALRLTPG
jgi:ribosome-associated protein